MAAAPRQPGLPCPSLQFKTALAPQHRRALLEAKESELAARREALAAVDAKIAGLSAKFEKSLALIEEDRRLVATYQQELEGGWGGWRGPWWAGEAGGGLGLPLSLGYVAAG